MSYGGEMGWLRVAQGALVALLMVNTTIALADFYTYVAPDGSVHFSNVPTDSRYQLLMREGNAPAPVAAATAVSSDRFARLVAHAAAETGLPAGLLHAVVRTESNYDPFAVSPKGAVGLMQLMPDTARQYGVTDARDPAANLLGGARYLRDLLDQFNNDLSVALAAYNAGPGAVMRSGGKIPPFGETRRYVPKVLDLYRQNGGGSLK